MAGSLEIRAKDARVSVKVDGQTLGGSFATIHDISVKPDVELSKKRFTGEATARGDLDIKGWDISFKTEKRDHLWAELWDLIQLRERNGQPFPDIVMTMTYKYRDGVSTLRTVTLSGDMVLKMDEDSIPQNGYQGNMWTGFCSRNTASSS